jgi:hypothetical protein
MIVTAAMTDKQAAQYLGESVADIAAAPDLVASPVDTPNKPVASNVGSTITLTATAVPTATAYKQRSRIDDGAWNEGAYQPGLTWSVSSAAPGIWEFEVKARNAALTESEWSEPSDPITIAPAARKRAAKKAASDE